MRTRKLCAFLTLSALLTLCLTAAIEAAMSDEEFLELCGQGSAKQVRAELLKGANPNAKDKYGTALMRSVGNQNPEVISILLRAGADVNAKDNGGYTALMVAAQGGFIHENCYDEAISILLKAGADVNAKSNEFGNTALICAARLRSPKGVSVLLKAGADVNAKNKDGVTALMVSTQLNSPEVVSVLLKAGADPNAKDKNGMTALMWTATANSSLDTRPEVVSVLLKAGADAYAEDNKGCTALVYAQRHHSSEVANVLVEAMKQGVREGDPESLYQLALQQDDTRKAIELFRKAASMGHQKAREALKLFSEEELSEAGQGQPKPKGSAMSDEEFDEKFLELCQSGSTEKIIETIKAGANVNMTDNEGSSALMWVASNQGPEVVSLMLKGGADVNAQDVDGFTALMCAAAGNKNPEVISLLLKAGADIDVRDEDGKTALDHAREMKNVAAVKLLEGKTGSPAANASIAGDKVNVRSKPNTSARVVKQLNTGHPVTIIRQDGDWFLIRTASGTEGWVFGKFVKR